ncbi:MAG: hypothetical protein SVQ76_02500 [Candidatus Nanohaloarchaea archaeon]|nr:hypothetical protein [Candidatus Nanohaloarchaea archaeon]
MQVDVPEDREEEIREHYLRDDVTEEMVRIAESREFSPTYPYGYGSRPDAVNFPGDFRGFVEDGAVAFHGSVERWKNPTLIGEVPADDLRTGWDLVMDIDCDEDMEFAKATAVKLLEELRSFGVENVSVKFSGNRGFHLGIRGECFPDNVQGRPIEDWYPELPQTIVSFLRDRLREELSEEFVEIDSSVRSEVYDGEGNATPYQLSDIENDWGDRHLFRLPYSVNEKSWLVSLPIEPSREAIMEFEKSDAELGEFKADRSFLDEFEDGEATELVVEALDWRAKNRSEEETKSFDGEFDVPDEAAPEEQFPPTIKNILQGLEDGRKRAVFILITFLQHVGYDYDTIEKMLWEWNERNDEPLDETYIRTQLNWHERQDEPLMPPNWDANGFYRDMQVAPSSEKTSARTSDRTVDGVYEEDPLTEATQNPVSYTFAKLEDERSERSDRDGDSEGSEKETVECPYCGKEYKGETKWYRDHVMECQG